MREVVFPFTHILQLLSFPFSSLLTTEENSLNVFVDMFTLSNEFNYPHRVAAYNRGSVHATRHLTTSANLMDSVFVAEGNLSTFLQTAMQGFGCSYVCLWSYDQSNLPQPFNCLCYKGGFYHERSDQPSSSSGSLAQIKFIEYQQSRFVVDQGSHVPGYAYVNNIPYLELKSGNLQKLARTETQQQFYQAAGIKTAVFMGCNAGEIELGFSEESQVNIEMEMRNLFPDDFSRQLPATREIPQPTDQNRPASPSSSLRSLSYDSPEYPPFLIDTPSTRYISENPQEAMVEQALRPSPSVFTTSNPHQQAIQALSQIRSPQIPSIESEEAAMAKAILAVICSSPSSASSSFQPQQNLPPHYPVSGQGSAFKWYGPSPLAPTAPMSARFRRQNMLKRSIAFLRSLNTMRSQEQMQASRPSSTQLHHMISERRRREKLNESFQALRSLLPPGTKKDKASVLTSTTEYLSSLKAQVAELSRKNEILEAQLLPKKTAAAAESETSSSSNERLEVRITQVSESTSAARLIDLQVTRRGEINTIDLIVSLLEFLKRDQNVSIMSIQANTTMEELTSVNHIVLRLKIEGEWDESAFQEAVRRVLNDQEQ